VRVSLGRVGYACGLGNIPKLSSFRIRIFRTWQECRLTERTTVDPASGVSIIRQWSRLLLRYLHLTGSNTFNYLTMWGERELNVNARERSTDRTRRSCSRSESGAQNRTTRTLLSGTGWTRFLFGDLLMAGLPVEWSECPAAPWASVKRPPHVWGLRYLPFGFPRVHPLLQVHDTDFWFLKVNCAAPWAPTKFSTV